MSVKKKEEKIVKTRIGYEFNCDICGKYLGFSYEYDDGYVSVPDKAVEVNEKFTISLEKCRGLKSKYEYLCEDCYNKYLEKIKNTLIENCEMEEED